MGFLGAKGAGDFFFLRQTAGGNFFCLTLFAYAQNTQNFVGNSKMDEKHKKGY